MQGTKKGISQKKTKMVKILQIKTIRYQFFLFILEKLYLKKQGCQEYG